MQKVFYDILNAGLWGKEAENVNLNLSEKEAEILFDMGRLQAVGGLIMIGMNEYELNTRSKKLDWINMLMHIEQTNRKINLLAGKIISELKNKNISAEVFKGSSVAKWYRSPLSRSYGDIDIVIPEGAERIENILAKKNIEYKRMHDDVVCSIEGISVEFHRQRDFAFCPKDNRILQQLVKEFPNSNEVYLACIIIHLRRHFLTYGIGMKQICDVAVMLKYADMDMDFLAEVIKKLNMERFCKALFGFIKKRFIVDSFPIEPDSGYGSDYIEEIVWNDGYLLKVKKDKQSEGMNDIIRIAGNAIFWIKRSIRMSRLMPREALWFVPYLIWRRIKISHKQL